MQPNYRNPGVAVVLTLAAVTKAVVLMAATTCLAAESPRLGVPPLLVSTAPTVIEDRETIGMLRVLLTRELDVRGFGPGGGVNVTLLPPEAVGVSLAARLSIIADELPALAASYVTIEMDLAERIVANSLALLAESLQLVVPGEAGETTVAPAYVYDLGGSINSYLERTVFFFFPATLPDGSPILDFPELRLRLWGTEVGWDMQKTRTLLSVL